MRLPALVLPALLALAPLAACRTPAPTPAAAERPSLLSLADARFEAGDYAAAADAYERHLAASPGGEGRERALLRLALVRLLPGSPLHDAGEARVRLAALAREDAGGAYGETAAYLLALLGEVAELERQLETLKRIDLEGLADAPDGGH